MSLLTKHQDREAERHRELWPEEDERIALLAAGTTPLNDHFAQGLPLQLGPLMRYVCALERRVADLEQQ